jgi:hypothetical protein
MIPIPETSKIIEAITVKSTDKIKVTPVKEETIVPKSIILKSSSSLSVKL